MGEAAGPTAPSRGSCGFLRNRPGRRSGGRDPEFEIERRLGRVDLPARPTAEAEALRAAEAIEPAPTESPSVAGSDDIRVDRAVGSGSARHPDVHVDRDIAETFDRAWRTLRRRRILVRHGGGFAVLPGNRELVSYYANSIAHLLGPFEAGVRARDALPAEMLMTP